MTDFFIFVVAVVAILVGGTIVNSWVRTRHHAPAALPDDSKTVPREAHDRLGQTVARLEARLATLERIATDKPNRLSAEIEHLR